MGDKSQVIVGAPWWGALVGALVGVLLGFCISEFRDWRERRRKRYGFLEALAVEINVCADLAKGYFDGRVMAPAYRLPLLAYERVLPEILSEGILTIQETQALIRFYFNVAALNFCLDQAQAVLMQKEPDRPHERLEREVRRAKLKARKLRKDSGPGNHYDAAIDVIRRHLPKDRNVRLGLSVEEVLEEAE